MILVVMEHSNGALKKSAAEMAGAAKALGREGPVTALILGSGVALAATEAASLVEQVLVADRPDLAEYDVEVWASAIAQIAKEGGAHTILMAGSRSGREITPRVAVKMDAALLEDVIELAHDAGVTRAQRYTYLARVTEKLETTSAVVVVTVKPGAFPPTEAATASAEQFDVELNLPELRVRMTGRTAEKGNRVALSEAAIVVAGGRGVGSAAGFVAMVEGLADSVGAAVAATRAVVDAGWRPYAEQVGQTGQTVQPKAYIAIGVSGAVQHLSGMNKSKYILAINKDKDAPIFKIADCGIIGDVGEVVPAIIGQLRQPAAK